MSVNSVLTGSWRKSNTDLKVHSVSSSVSPKITLTGGIVALSDEYDVWRLLVDTINIAPLGNTSFSFTYDGFPPSANKGVFETHIYFVGSHTQVGITTISPNNNNIYYLNIHNVGAVNLVGAEILLRRIKSV